MNKQPETPPSKATMLWELKVIEELRGTDVRAVVFFGDPRKSVRGFLTLAEAEEFAKTAVKPETIQL
jgi:hypothetical protein